jgi:hypothetical protein
MHSQNPQTPVMQRGGSIIFKEMLMEYKIVPGPHNDAYNKGWKDGYQEIYGVNIPVPQGKSTDYVKGYRIGYSSGKGMAQNGDDVGTDEIPDICHNYSAEWCHGWSDRYKVGWISVAK